MYIKICERNSVIGHFLRYMMPTDVKHPFIVHSSAQQVAMPHEK